MNIGRNLFVSACISVIFLFCPAISAGQNGGEVRTIVIDPGHGGHDAGCVSGKIYEKDIVLKVALLLGDLIKKEMPDVNVVYTRKTDIPVELHRRGEIANKAKADLFISIHVNATKKNIKAPSGGLTLIMGKETEDRNLDMAMKENDVISYEDDYTTMYKEYLSGSSEMFIIYSLAQYVSIEQSIVFANMVQNNLESGTSLPDRGIRRQHLLVLWYTTMPSVLVELGFINNDTDRAYITTDKGQKQMAAALLNAVKEYRGWVNNKVAANGQTPAAPPVTSAKPADRIAGTTADKPETRPEGRREVAGKGSPGVVYRVQILSAMKKIPQNSSEFKKYKGKAHERHEGGRYRYYVGECRTYAEVLELQERVRKSFRDAFAVAFRDGKPISVTEARKLTD